LQLLNVKAADTKKERFSKKKTQAFINFLNRH